MSSTPYFTSRQRVSFTRPNPSYQAAAHGNPNELLRAFRSLGARLSQVETRVGGGTISLKSSSPVSSPPPAATVAASTKPGVFIVQITNPEFAGKGNQPHTPIQHRLRFSSTADFAVPDTLPIGQQTYYEVSKYGAGQRKWVSLDSSFDGINFNQSQVLGPFVS
jgi:hypothetical protein